MSFGIIGPGFGQGPGQMAGGPADIPTTSGPGQLAGGPAAIGNPVAEQTQQMAANPVYGQNSPFQPPRNVGSGQLQSLATPGYDPIVGFPYGSPGRMVGGPAPIGQMPGQLAGGPAPIDTGNMGFGKSMAGPAMALSMMPGAAPLVGQMLQGPGQLAGGPAAIAQGPGQLAGGPAAIQQGPGQIAGGPAPVGGPQFQGGLRPAPRNYRPPMRRQYPRSLIGY